MSRHNPTKDDIERFVDVSGGWRPAARALGLPPEDATTLHDIIHDKPCSIYRKRRIWNALAANKDFVAAWLDAALAHMDAD